MVSAAVAVAVALVVQVVEVGKMFKYIKKYSLPSTLGIFFKFTEAVFELMLPLMMVGLIDLGLNMNNPQEIKKRIFMMLGLTIFGYLASITCQYLASYVGQSIAGEIREDLFQKTRDFSLDNYRKFSVETLMNRITVDVTQVQDMIAKTIRLAVRAPILMVGSLFALYQISPKLSLTLMKAFPFMIVVVVFFMWLSLHFYKENQIFLDQVLSTLRERVEGMRIVRAYNQSNQERAFFKDENEQYSKSQSKVGWVAALSNPFTSLMMNGILLFLIYLGALQINSGSMSQGQMVAVINYCTQLVLAFIAFMNLVLIFSRGLVSSKRVLEVLNEEDILEHGDLQIKDQDDIEIEFKNVSFNDPLNGKEVLKDLNFVISPGENVGVFGLTGSGKTSLSQLILRNIEVSSGEILINKHNIKKYNINNLREQISYVSQDPLFLYKSVEENVLMGRQGDVEKSLRLSSAQEIVDKGLDLRVEEKGKNFSGGQRQRIHLARIFIEVKKILILDDSLGGLDNKTGTTVFTNIMKNKNQSKIIISQKYKELQQMDSIFCLENGEIVDKGTAKELLERNENFKLMYSLQVGEDV